jgi:hypothetical protein
MNIRFGVVSRRQQWTANGQQETVVNAAVDVSFSAIVAVASMRHRRPV